MEQYFKMVPNDPHLLIVTPFCYSSICAWTIPNDFFLRKEYSKNDELLCLRLDYKRLISVLLTLCLFLFAYTDEANCYVVSCPMERPM